MGVFEIIFGMVFAVVGGGVFCIGFFKPPGTVVENAGIAMIAGALFGLIGIGIIVSGIRKIVKVAKAKADGERFYAKIWAHDDDYSFQVNHQPAVALVLRFFDTHGRLRQETVPTGKVNRTQYPLGSTVVVSEYDGKCYLVDSKPQSIPPLREQELMDPGAQPLTLCGANGAGLTAAGTVYGRQQRPAAAGGMMVIACPGCSNSIGMMPGSQATCPFCSRVVTLTSDHQIR